MIEIEGLPEGWKAVAYRVPKGNIEFVFIENVVREAKPQDKKCLIIEKIQPRRIVLEETEEKYLGCQTLYIDGTEIMIMTNKTWREVKETDIPLNNNDLKLSLSVDECRNVRSLIKDFENLGWFVNPARSLLLQKITKFIKENS
mgnify:FL=1